MGGGDEIDLETVGGAKVLLVNVTEGVNVDDCAKLVEKSKLVAEGLKAAAGANLPLVVVAVGMKLGGASSKVLAGIEAGGFAGANGGLLGVEGAVSVEVVAVVVLEVAGVVAGGLNDAEVELGANDVVVEDGANGVVVVDGENEEGKLNPVPELPKLNDVDGVNGVVAGGLEVGPTVEVAGVVAGVAVAVAGRVVVVVGGANGLEN